MMSKTKQEILAEQDRVMQGIDHHFECIQNLLRSSGWHHAAKILHEKHMTIKIAYMEASNAYRGPLTDNPYFYKVPNE